MKKNIFYFFLAATLFAGCKKEDASVPAEVALERIPLPLIVKTTGSQAIDVLNLASFKGSFSVGLYFTSDAPPSKFDVVVRKNGSAAAVKVFKTDVSTFPTTLEITSAQLASLFGTPVVLNDNYDIGVDIYTTAGKKYEAFPATGVAYASGIATHPGSSTSARYSAICQYNDAIYQGNFVVVSDDWADYVPGDVISITKIDATHFSFVHISPINPVPIIVTVKTTDNTVSVAKQSVGTQWPLFYGGVFTAPFVVTGGSAASSFVAPCDQTVTLNLNYGYSASTFGGGPYPLVLKKQ